MQYTVIIASLLAAAASAAPLDPAITPAVRATPFDAPVSPAIARPIARRGQQPINDCGDSSFNNQSSGGSPRIDDCKQIIADLKAIGPHTFVSCSLTPLKRSIYINPASQLLTTLIPRTLSKISSNPSLLSHPVLALSSPTWSAKASADTLVTRISSI